MRAGFWWVLPSNCTRPPVRLTLPATTVAGPTVTSPPRAGVAAHDGVELDVAASAVQVVAHGAAQRDFATRHDEVALHLVAIATLRRQEGVALDRFRDVDHAAAPT